LDLAKSAALNSLSSTDAQRSYRHAIEQFIDWYCSEPRLSFSETVVLGTASSWNLAAWCRAQLICAWAQYFGCNQRTRSAVNDRIGIEAEV